ncbi:MAG: protein BatD [Bacteroidetes bacterium]|nr:protein BatD [Bacteroidota bacterium]
MKHILSVVLLFFTLSGVLSAQDVSFNAQAPRQVSVGQRFYLTFSINQEGTGFISPGIEHFEVQSGPSSQSSSQIQFINGKVSQSISYSYTFVLLATEPGVFTIPSASIAVKGKKYFSNTVTINVIGQAISPQSRAQGQHPSQQKADVSNLGNDIFLKAVPSKSDPYLGEQIIVTYKLYTPTNRLRINPSGQAPAYPGFWSQDLMKDLQQYPQYNETVNGKKYIVAEVRKVALFPQKTGALTIAPLEQDVVYSVKVKSKSPFADDPFFSNDPFFKNFFDDSNLGFDYQNVEKSLKSNSVTVQVKPLPAQNRPIDFTGAIGQFNFKPSLDKSQLKANEAVTLKLTVAGSGNLNLIEKPSVVFPPDFEVYDPKITDNIHSSNSGISGSRTFEYLVIPRTAGDFKIAPVQFSYFDLAKKEYVNLSSPEYNIKVLKGDGTAAAMTPVDREDVKYIGNDIRYLMDAPIALHPIGKHFYGSWLFWLLLSLPVLVFLAFVIIWRNHIRSNSDIGNVRRRKATRIATLRLKKAKSLLAAESQEAFHIEISQALWGYISDKFNIPLSELSMDTAFERLNDRNVDADLIQRFIDTLQHSEFARFAPGDKTRNMELLYNEAIEVITHTEEQLK